MEIPRGYRPHVVLPPPAPDDVVTTDASKRHPEDVQTAKQLVADIKTLRQAKGMSQRQAAENAGIPQSMWSGIERGAIDSQLETYQKVALAIGSRLEFAVVSDDPNLSRFLASRTYTNRQLNYAAITACPRKMNDGWHTPESIAAAMNRPRFLINR